jgi:cytochrome c-type protein NapB
MKSRGFPRLLVLLLPASVAGACLTGDELDDVNAAQVSVSAVPARAAKAPPPADPVSSVLPQRVRTGAAARGSQSEGRRLSQPVPWDGELMEPYELAEDRSEARARSLAERATRRAFEGAPPVMPHVPDLFGSDCLDCHASGMAVDEERVAHAMSHPVLASCTQCHVEAEARGLPPASPPENTFAGRRPAAPSARPFPGGPPAIPHQLTMRGRCLSCHGEFGYPGLRTSHPERALCMQCHVRAGTP